VSQVVGDKERVNQKRLVDAAHAVDGDLFYEKFVGHGVGGVFVGGGFVGMWIHDCSLGAANCVIALYRFDHDCPSRTN